MRCGRAAELCEHLAELEAVLNGDTDQAVARLDDVEARIEAVVDATGSRSALLTLAVEPGACADGENAILREQLDDSPAIVWLKDLEGRHIRVNRQFISVLGGSEGELQGKTDAELPTAATVDGPRLQDPERAASEPVEFGYTVPTYQDRPALSVLRFLVHGADGEPVAVCGVAAPMAQSEIAENEAVRLMQLNRWSRLDSDSIRSDVLKEWGVSVGGSADPMPMGTDHESWESAPEAVDAGAPVAVAATVAPEPDPSWEAELAAVTAARAEAESARDEAMAARAGLEERVRSLEEQLEHARWAAEPGAEPVEGDAAEAIAAARAEAEAARAGVEQARREAEAARSVAMTAHAETEAARAETEAARAEAQAARADAEEARAQIAAAHAAVQDEIASLRAEAEAARTEAAAARTESASAWVEAENERTNAGLFASQLADARRQLQHQRAQAALAQQQLQIPRCSAAAQASRPSQKGLRIESAVQIPRRERKPVAQPLDPTLMSQPAPPASVGAGSSQHDGSQRGGLLGRLRSRGRH
ncbi:MAG: PAS domain-containing protein [Solirubrobacteraceae bacterium]